MPMNTDRLIGWNTLNKYCGSIHAVERHITLNDTIISFNIKEHFKISPRIRKIICKTHATIILILIGYDYK
jgi:hypothetical protein